MNPPTPFGDFRQPESLLPLHSLLTVALIVKNEAKHLAACLDRIAPLQCTILLIDSGSTDDTLNIAKQYGAQIHQFPDWQGFGVQRNRAHAFIQTPWVLWLDTDERLPETARQHIQTALNHTAADGKTLFAINRLSIAYGREIRHGGWYPDKVVRLYPVAWTQYSQDLVHESVQIPDGARIVDIQGDVLHHTYDGLNQHLSKMQQYTLSWAEQRRGKKTVNLFSVLPRALFNFIKCYVMKRGFLDGQQGLLIAIMGAIYTFMKYAQLWLINQQDQSK